MKNQRLVLAACVAVLLMTAAGDIKADVITCPDDYGQLDVYLDENLTGSGWSFCVNTTAPNYTFIDLSDYSFVTGPCHPVTGCPTEPIAGHIASWQVTNVPGDGFVSGYFIGPNCNVDNRDFSSESGTVQYDTASSCVASATGVYMENSPY